jgi:hypothetical protein
MIEVESKHKAGAVILKRGELPRYHQFYDSLDQVKVPKGTRIFKASGLEFVRGLNNVIVECMTEPKYVDVAWFWIMDDDHTFESDILLKMLDHNKDCTVPLVSMRVFPFDTVLVHGPLGQGRHYTFGDMNINNGECQMLQHGDTVGAAGMLLNRKVFEKISHPYFEVGGVYKDAISEDITFADRVWKYGFDIHVSLNTKMGHMTPMNLTPYQKQDGTFGVMVQTLGGQIPWNFGIN